MAYVRMMVLYRCSRFTMYITNGIIKVGGIEKEIKIRKIGFVLYN